MRDSLSKALRKHYTRQGNRLVFSNGMTLNQLALEMWEKLGYREIDASVLSRVIKNQRKFTSKQIKVFAEILKLTSNEFRRLYTEYCCEVLSKADIKEDFINDIIYQTDGYEQILDKIEEARLYDALDLAYRWENETEDFLKSKIKILKKARVLKKLYDLWGRLLIKKVWTILEYRHRDVALPEIIYVPSLLERIAKITNNREFIGRAEAVRGRICFHQKLFSQALKHDSESLHYLRNCNEIQWVIGRLMLTYAILNEDSKILELQEQIEKTLYTSQIYQKFSVYRGLSGTYIVVRNFDKAQKYLQQTWDLFDKQIKDGEGNFKNKSKITLYHSEELFYQHFGTYNKSLRNLEKESKRLTELFRYNQYLIEAGQIEYTKFL